MFRLNHVIHLWYLVFILGWMGYASGLHAAPLQLESVPLSLVLKVEPNLMLLIDDSASMNWEVSTADLVNDGRYTGTQRDGSSPAGAGQVKHRDNNDDGIADCSFGTAPGSPLPAGQSLYGYAYGVEFPTNGDPSPDPRKCNTADDAEWRFRNHNFNPIYFNPNLTYLPWAGVDAAGNPFQNMNIHTAKDNPYAPASPTIDLTRNNSKGDPNITSDRNGDSMPDGFRYYTWTDANGNGLFDDGEETVHFIATKSENEQQNFANWFSYYRKREYAVKARYGAMLATMSSTRVGLVTLHNNVNISPFSPNSSVATINLPLQSIDLDAQAPTQPNTDPARGNRRRSLDALYSFRTQGGTPLRVTLNAIGEYLEDKFGHTLFPNDNAYLTSTNGGACQQSFVILMTDGIDNDSTSVVGNTDAVPGADDNDSAFKPGFNGGPYADIPGNTLADVAMHYYQRDLRPLMDDIVPISQLDQARHQHMVTYTITFDGFNGTLTRDPFPNENGTTFWPQSLADDKARIDDLRHAAFNGRGQFLQANNAGALADALRRALTGIAQRTSSAASVTLNAGALTTTTRVFQTRFDSGDWSGQLLSIKLDPTTSAPLPIPNPSDSIDSGALLDQTSVRTILTYKPSTGQGMPGQGIPFTWSELDAAQQAALNRNISGVVDNLGQARLAYLRGSNADEGQGNHFRVRAHRLGDIIDSDPFFVGPPALPEDVGTNPIDPSQPNTYVQFRDDPTNRNRPKMILVGSNDGMLHIFNANNPFDATTGQGDPKAGQELLAYVPNSVLRHTVDLTSPAYRHRYYVNGSPTAGDVFLNSKGDWRTVAVGGLGAGGQGYFALDITSPTTFGEDQASNIVLWEFSDVDDPDLGLTFSQPSLVRMQNGKWAAVVGNGYNNADPNAGTDTRVSTNGRAMFFILFLDGPGADGKWSEGEGGDYIKIDTGVGDTTTPNGLATPAAVDTNADFTVDYLVAGDLRGNLWRIDVTSANSSDWKLPANRKLLFTATDSNAPPHPQPITSRPEVGRHPQNLGGFVVYVGTGKYLEKSDTSTVGATTQSFYGIWDKDLSGVRVERSQLVQQTVIAAPTVTDADGNPRLTRVTSDNPINWENQRGFFLDLPAPGEKQVSNSILRSGRIIFSTLIPNDQPCNFGGTSFLFALDVHGGTQLDRPFFDINKDRLFDDQDMTTVNGQLVPFSALQSEVGIIQTPTLITDGPSDLALTSGADGVPKVESTNRGHEPAGRQAWRKITQ